MRGVLLPFREVEIQTRQGPRRHLQRGVAVMNGEEIYIVFASLRTFNKWVKLRGEPVPVTDERDLQQQTIERLKNGPDWQEAAQALGLL